MDSPDAWVRRGAELVSQGSLSGAISLFEKGLRHEPGHVIAMNGLAGALQVAGRFTEANRWYAEAVARSRPPLQWRVASNALVCLQYQPGMTEAALKEAAVRAGTLYGAPEVLVPRRRGAGDPLRVGFVSADLCDHPVGLFLLPLLRHIDRRRIEPVLFSTGGRDDATAGELRALAEWHDVAALDRDALVARLRRHELDVAVDLSGHTAGNRLAALALRVAPVQLAWLGYFATTGIGAIDHILMDLWHVPLGSEALFTEHVVRLPASRFCYEPAPFAPAVAPLPAWGNGYVTFGSFNNTAKINPVVLDVWADVLRRVPGSRLLLKWATFADPAYREGILQAFTSRGVAGQRVELRPASPHRALLEQYADVDIALDPFPFSGGHTSCEALWMGLPVVTLPGDRPVSRQTLSLVACLDRPDWLDQWVATCPEDYAAKAQALASEWQGLDSIRGSLRQVMQASPLMDANRFARDWEDAVIHLAAGR